MNCQLDDVQAMSEAPRRDRGRAPPKGSVAHRRLDRLRPGQCAQFTIVSPKDQGSSGKLLRLQRTWRTPEVLANRRLPLSEIKVFSSNQPRRARDLSNASSSGGHATSSPCRDTQWGGPDCFLSVRRTAGYRATSVLRSASYTGVVENEATTRCAGSARR